MRRKGRQPFPLAKDYNRNYMIRYTDQGLKAWNTWIHLFFAIDLSDGGSGLPSRGYSDRQPHILSRPMLEDPAQLSFHFA